MPSIEKIIEGGWVSSATVRVVVMSNIWFSADRINDIGAGDPAFWLLATAKVQISRCSAAARANSAFAASALVKAR